MIEPQEPTARPYPVTEALLAALRLHYRFGVELEVHEANGDEDVIRLIGSELSVGIDHAGGVSVDKEMEFGGDVTYWSKMLDPASPEFRQDCATFIRYLG